MRRATGKCAAGGTEEGPLLAAPAVRPSALPAPLSCAAVATAAAVSASALLTRLPCTAADASAFDCCCCRCCLFQTRPMALLPEPVGALLGAISKTDPTFAKVASEAARTIPGRENGGNCDIKNLSRGCRVYFPVFVEGANLSVGDMHFSQVSHRSISPLPLKGLVCRGGVHQLQLCFLHLPIQNGGIKQSSGLQYLCCAFPCVQGDGEVSFCGAIGECSSA